MYRERERDRYMYVCIHIYIYIYRERERERLMGAQEAQKLGIHQSGGCSQRGVQWMGVASYNNKTAYNIM